MLISVLSVALVFKVLSCVRSVELSWLVFKVLSCVLSVELSWFSVQSVDSVQSVEKSSKYSVVLSVVSVGYWSWLHVTVSQYSAAVARSLSITPSQGGVSRETSQ